MKCLEAKRLITPYLEDSISERDLPDFVEHVKNCPSCFDELEIYSSIYYSLSNDDDRIDISAAGIRKELDTRLETLIQTRSRRRFFAITVMIAETALIVSLAVSLFPQNYKDVLESILEFFWW